MSRYYFNIEEAVLDEDKLGADLSDLDAVKQTAVQIMVESLWGRGGRFWDAPNWRLVVADETGLTLLTLELSATLAPAISAPQPVSAPEAKSPT